MYSATLNKGLFHIWKGVLPGCILSPCWFNLCGISIMKWGKLKREVSVYTKSKDVTQKELCHCPYPQLWKPEFRGFVHRVMQELKQRSPRFYKETHFIWNRLWEVQGFPSGSDGKEYVCNAREWVLSLGWEHPLEKELATHSSVLPWRILCTEEPGGLQSMVSQRVAHNWETMLSLHFTWEGQA